MRYGIFLLLFAALQLSATAQLRPTGIAWNIPETDQESLEQIEQIHANGFRYVYVQGVPGSVELRALSSRGMYVIQQFPLYYLTPFTMRTQQAPLLESLQAYAKFYKNYPYFEGISLFYEGLIHHQDMMEQVSGWMNSNTVTYPFFYATHQSGITPSSKLSPIFLAKSMEEAYQWSALHPDHPLVLEWLNEIETTDYLWYRLIKQPGKGRIYLPYRIMSDTSRYGVALKTMRRLQQDPEDILIDAQIPVKTKQPGTSLLMFFLLCFSILSYFSFDPSYRKSVLRFFRSNKMFTEEVSNRRLRLPFPAFLVFLNIVLLYGILHLAVQEYLITDAVAFMIRSLFPSDVLQHLTWLSFGFGAGYGLTGCLMLVLWGKWINHNCSFGQYALVFLWPMHLLFFIVLLFFFFLTSFPHPVSLFLLWFIAMTLPLLTFIFVNLSFSRFGKRRGIIIQSLLMSPIIGGAVYGLYQLYNHTPFFEYLQLALLLG